ncbi:hypothetical protein BDQ17DRAFT_1546521 [Cyathus striatus]|nr:hypothetical protein BDQ17DRAFT_1546521 [Cyathus striatus]
MKEANEQESSESESVDGEGTGTGRGWGRSDSDKDGFGSIDEDDSGMEYSDVDSMISADNDLHDEGEEFTGPPPPSPAATKRKINPIHLPDDLLTAAFSPKAKAVVAEDGEDEAKGKRRKKRKTGASAKDVVLGSRIVYTLTTTTQSRPTPALQPKKTKSSSSACSLSKGHQNPRGRDRNAEPLMWE